MNNSLRHIVLSLLCLLAMGATAQITAVHGTVSDEFGEITGASVCEIDGSGRIIEATVTDINGNFSMKIRNPKDKIRFSYVGCKAQTLPIDKDEYIITLKSETNLKEVTVEASGASQPGGGGILAKLFGGGGSSQPAIESKPTIMLPAEEAEYVEEVKEPEKVKVKIPRK